MPTVNRSSRGQAPGFIFAAVFQNKFFTTPLVGQGGPMILDNQGRYVWLQRAKASAPDTLNLQVQRYQGKPVLTFWDGTVKNTGEMLGTWHVLNDRYKEIAKLTSANGWDPSGHEFFVEGGDSLLEAALRAGLALDYGCSIGNCGQCRARIVSGQVQKIRHADYALTAAEKTAGVVLMCSNTAVTDLVIEAHEAGMAKFVPAFQALYDSMSDAQKKTADAMFSRKVRTSAAKKST